MAFRSNQPNFSKGEIAPELRARVDVAYYGASLARARDVCILKYGGITKRPGTRFVGEVYDPTADVRLMPFEFSITQTYALEMGQGYMRPLALGGFVLNEALAVTAITRATSAQVTAAFHGYSVGDQVYFANIEGMTQINGKVGRVLVAIDDDNFIVDINTLGFGTFTGSTGGITRVGAPTPPPTPPTVPPVVPPTEPPVVTQPPNYHCVTDDTLILMANGTEKPARELEVGDLLRTQDEHTLQWGDYPVSAIVFADELVFLAEGLPRATAAHRFWRDGWVRMETLGKPDGIARVAKITVAGAHTYVSAGVLSHNIKARDPDL